MTLLMNAVKELVIILIIEESGNKTYSKQTKQL
jgi:hypothetical protein